MQTSTTIRADVRRYLTELSGVDHFADDDHLVDGGVVASMHLLDLVTWVEDRFSIAVGPDDVDRGRFTSVQAIVDFVLAARR